jgi:uncharacterized protein (DUF2252 family)
MARKKVETATIAKTPISPAFMAKPKSHHTLAERKALGAALRVATPRESHAEWEAPENRSDPIDSILASEVGRREDLLPIRHGRMLATPFTFYRGAAAIMAADLSNTPSTGYTVQACGDCHLLNFGAFATPERRIIFDINDFDETFPAPWEWDLKRLAGSFVVAARANRHGPEEQVAAAEALVRSYATAMAELAEMPALDVWYSYLDWRDVIAETNDATLRRKRTQVLNKAIARDHAAEFVKLAHYVDGLPRIKDQPPLLFHPDEFEAPEFKAGVAANISQYRESLTIEKRVLFDRYEIADVAIKVVGVGSVGTLCAVALYFAAEGDALFLQVKQVMPSVLQPYVGKSPFSSDGERVVFGQRLMQAASDVFLGHFIGIAGGHYYVRQLRDVKVRPMVELYTPGDMVDFARTCGGALARAHARSGDPAVLAGYMGKGRILSRAIGAFAAKYADQNEADHARLVEAVREGRIEAHFEEA